MWLEFTHSGARKMPAEMDTGSEEHTILWGGITIQKELQCPAVEAMVEVAPPQCYGRAEGRDSDWEHADDFTEKPWRQLWRCYASF